MTWTRSGAGLLVGLVAGFAIGFFGRGGMTPPVWASNDRHEDYVLCTGPVAIRPGAPTDGIWLLDYRSGKLLGTLIDRISGKVVNWAEVDLVTEMGLTPRQNVHFVMTTGNI